MLPERPRQRAVRMRVVEAVVWTVSRTASLHSQAVRPALASAGNNPAAEAAE